MRGANSHSRGNLNRGFSTTAKNSSIKEYNLDL